MPRSYKSHDEWKAALSEMFKSKPKGAPSLAQVSKEGNQRVRSAALADMWAGEKKAMEAPAPKESGGGLFPALNRTLKQADAAAGGRQYKRFGEQ